MSLKSVKSKRTPTKRKPKLSCRLIEADVTSHIPLLNQSVHCVVTSPPYFGLRDYSIEGQLGAENQPDCLGWATGSFCGTCYACRLTQACREVWRVLRDDGTFWLNLGDSYAHGTSSKRSQSKTPGVGSNHSLAQNSRERIATPSGLKTKDLIGVPWRIAFALQADGWYLRMDNVWAKRNCTPESIPDRTTKSHEYVFMLSKSKKYYFDCEAIKEDANAPEATGTYGTKHQHSQNSQYPHSGNHYHGSSKRRKRSVWFLPTKPYKGAHYAVFPPYIPEIAILAGTSDGGCCSECGKPRRRRVLREKNKERDVEFDRKQDTDKTGRKDGHVSGPGGKVDSVTSAGWEWQCDCGGKVKPCVVLDPFVGSGTSLFTAMNYGRNAVGIDLNQDYLENDAAVRIQDETKNPYKLYFE